MATIETIKTLNDNELMELGKKPEPRRADRGRRLFDGGQRKPTSRRMLEARGASTPSGQSTVYDGRTGDAFDRKGLTVGLTSTCFKLHHLVDDKIPRAGSIRTVLRSSPSSRWAARRSSAGNVSAKMEVWALGKPTARPTRLQENAGP